MALRRTLLLALAIATPAGAQVTPGDTTSVYQLEGVTVTTTRTAVNRWRIPQKIEVIAARDLELSGSRTVAEGLRATTPVDVIEFPGLLTGVSIRGFRPQFAGISPRTLVLLNGRPAGTANLSLLGTGGVDRVEVLRGPGSALYGSNAMSGVVNVISRRSAGPVGGSISTGYGSFGTYRVAVATGGVVGGGLDFDLGVDWTGQHTGYRTGSRRTFASDSLWKTLADGSSEKLAWTSADTTLTFTEYASQSGRARVGYVASEHWRFDVSGEGYRAANVQNPGDLNPQEWDTRSLKDVSRGSVELAVLGGLGRHRASARIFSALEATDYFSSPEPPHHVNFRTPIRTGGAQLQDIVRLGGHEITAGVDYTAAKAESEAFDAEGGPRAPFNPDLGIRSAAAFAQGRFAVLEERLTATAGLRFDRVRYAVRETPHLAGYPPNQVRHSVVTPSAGIRFAVTAGAHVYGNLGRGFVTPDAFQVAGYHERSAGEGRGSVLLTRGNSALRPETSRSWDAGLALVVPRAALDLEVTYFSTRVADRVTSELLPGSGELTASGDTILSISTYLNADRAEIRGLEARIGYDVGSLVARPDLVRLFANGTRIFRAEERPFAAGADQRIRNVADLTLIAGLDLDGRAPWTARLAGRYVGERVDSDYVAWWAPGEILYPAYLVFDLSGAVELTGRYRVGLELRNLTDEDYFEVRGYNLPGRAVRLSVSAAW